MELEKYKKCLYRTLKEIYPVYFKKKILRKMCEDGLILNDKRKGGNGQLNLMMLNVSDIDLIDDKFKCILLNDENENRKSIYKYIEEFEYEKEYRHGCFFKIDGYSQEIVQELISNNYANLYIKSGGTYDNINSEFRIPTIKQTQDVLYIKFNHKLENKQSEEIKYVIMAIIHTKEKMLEIRLDKVGSEYKNPIHDFYAYIIDSVLNAVKELIGIQIENIDFKSIVNYMKDEKDDVTIYAQKMTRNGSVAYLEAASNNRDVIENEDAINNEDLVMPILGEFKAFMKNNDSLLEQTKETKKIKKRLQELIEEIEVTSDLPKVKITWAKKGIKVGIDHEYKNRQYSFFMYFDELIEGKERMEHVREYLINCYREIEEQT